MLVAHPQPTEVYDGTSDSGTLYLRGDAAITATRELSVLVEFGDYVTDASESVFRAQEQWSCICGIENLLLGLRASGSKDSTSAELMRQLETLRGLRPGWDSYDAPVLSPQAIELARDFLGSVLASESAPTPVRVCASVEGGVGIVFQRGSRYADVEFLNDGSIVGGASDGGGRVDVAEWRDADTKEMLDWISEHL